MDDIERMPHIMWIDSQQLPGLTGEEITHHLADTRMDPYEAAGLGGIKPLELEATLRDAASAAWECYDNVDNRAPDANVRLPPATVFEKLLEIEFISKTRPCATFARVELASAHAAAPAARQRPTKSGGSSVRQARRHHGPHLHVVGDGNP
eukprot:jgi/Tetstr1/457135/TSEL_043785.t1